MDEEEFTDGRGRLIVLTDDGSDVEARHNGKEVGRFGFQLVEQPRGGDIPHAHDVDVEPEYQRAGIALAMIKLVFERYGQIQVPGPNPMVSDNHITTDGLALWRKAEEQGYCFPLWERPSHFDEDEEHKGG